MTTIAIAKLLQQDVEDAVKQLNDATAKAAQAGLKVQYNTIPFRAIGRKPHDVITADVTVGIDSLE